MTLQLPAAGRHGSDRWPPAAPPGRSGGPRPSLAQVLSGLIGPPGLRLGRHRSTTAHLCAVYPCQTEAGLGPNGLYLGTDGLSGGATL